MKRHFGQSLNSSAAAKRTLFVLACFYVLAGLAVAVSTAVAGDPVGAFLGFLIVTGTIAIAVAFNMLFHLESTARRTQQSMDEILRRLEPSADDLQPATQRAMSLPKDTEVTILDLAAIGPGDPSLLAAVRLDRDLFPRLVTAMENHPPARSEVATDPGGVGHNEIGNREIGSSPSAGLDGWESGAQGFRDDTPGEAQLRQEFAEMIRRQDFAGALAVGRRIVAILPNRDIAREFLEIEPLLSSKLPRTTQPPVRSRAAGDS